MHACTYDCILHSKEFSNFQQCPICNKSRYKINDGKGKKIPHKVLRHFPLISRLKQLFASRHVASEMRWHKEKRVVTNDTLWHPANGEWWKHFDREFPQFDSDSRNVRLRLTSDSFNSFANMSVSYSMWPVMLISCNLPPWKCMKKTNFFMSLLISSSKSPGKKINIYLQPLIDELKELWNYGVRT